MVIAIFVLSLAVVVVVVTMVVPAAAARAGGGGCGCGNVSGGVSGGCSEVTLLLEYQRGIVIWTRFRVFLWPMPILVSRVFLFQSLP